MKLCYLFLSEEDLERLFEKWASEAENYAEKKAKFEKYMNRLKEAEVPFMKKQDDLLKRKRERNESAYLTAEERDEIWRPFRGVRQRIEKEIYGE